MKTIHEDPACGNIALSCLNEDLDDLTWECNLAAPNIEVAKGIGTANIFWTDVLKAWAEFNFCEDMSEVENPIIWYNSHIRVENIPVFWKKCFNKGLLRVSDLFVKGAPITPQLAKQRFHLTTMEYNSLLSAIPKQIKEMCHYSIDRTPLPSGVLSICLEKSVAGVGYQKLCSEPGENVFSAKAVKWEEELGCMVSSDEML